MVFIMDNPGLAQKSNNETPLGFTSVKAIPPDHASPGVTVVSHVGVEVPQQNNGVPRRGIIQHPQQGRQEVQVLRTTTWPVGRNDRLSPTRRRRDVTLSSTGVNPNMRRLSWRATRRATSKPSTACRLWATLE
ncbi:hypothetical protein AMECASPLE_034210 [Ameca splendens]|uniref:Uncharacterized protein n=1 Tax=Ameca splendens TaxID=208324 RepID=A0ABV0XWC2_9TELE